MSDTLNDIWHDRRVNIGYETAEELAKHAHPLNWRGHPESQASATNDALDSLGWIDEIKVNVNTGNVFNGHLRISLALAKDPAMRLPVDYYDLSPDEEALALQVLDATTEMAEPIPDKLAALLARTREMTADRPGLGAMLERLRLKAGINGNGSAPPEPPPMVNKAEELQAKWQVKPGDLFEFESLTTPGRFHRLLCGDCREPDDLMRLTDGQQVNGCFTSPPYAEQRKQQYGGVPVGEYVEWWGAVQTNVRAAMAGDGSFFVNIKEHCEDGQRVLYCKKLAIAMVEVWGWRWVDELCWLRPALPGIMGDRFKNGFEPVYHFSLGDIRFNPTSVTETGTDLSKMKTYDETDGSVTLGSSYNGQGGGSVRSKNFLGALPDNVLSINRGFSDNPGHGAVFPVALPTFFLKAYSDPGDIWLDPFCGSGTVLVAAENEGRIAMGTEILPKYCSVILERMSNLGLTPKRIS